MKMNLVTDPWIPVIFNDGSSALVSLYDALKRSQDIRDLSVRPHERIAIMRLLICIAQTSLNGPGNPEDWEKCLNKILPQSLAYLNLKKDCFELFGEAQRFLQIDGIRAIKKDRNEEECARTSASKLDIVLATGNNTTLFDNGAGGLRIFSSEKLALMLLTFQCFSPCGRIGISHWHEKETPGKGSSQHAPCTGNVVHAIIRGKNLLQTIHYNLINRETVENVYGINGWGYPSWEQMPKSLDDNSAIQNATLTYLGRLVPLSRAIRLVDGHSIILSNALTYPYYPAFREATATVLLSKNDLKGDQSPRLMTVSLHKALWRELPSILMSQRHKYDQMSGPLALENMDSCHSIDLWTGAVVTDKAKILDSIESNFHIPADMLTDIGRSIYEKGIEHAAQWATALKNAIEVYAETLRMEKGAITPKGQINFWGLIEKAVPHLINLTKEPSSLGKDDDFSTTSWGKEIWRCAKNVYRMTCAHSTPREMEAFFKGEKKLNLNKDVKKRKKK